MPELPEVETVVSGLRRRLARARIASVSIATVAYVSPPVEAEAWQALEGARVEAVERAGKYIVITLAAGLSRWQMMIHLGMTGKALLLPGDDPPVRHTHGIVEWDDGRQLRLVDARRFGRLTLAPAPERGWAVALGIAAGVEPLEADAATFVARLGGRRSPIKNALLNQKLLRGLGNIYADEALFRAGIHPCARSVSAPRLRKLRLAVRAVLRQAIAAGGSSISDYVDSAGRRGWFQTRHRVYGRTGLPCPRCRGPIRRLVLAGRSAHFCPNCQRR